MVCETNTDTVGLILHHHSNQTVRGQITDQAHKQTRGGLEGGTGRVSTGPFLPLSSIFHLFFSSSSSSPLSVCVLLLLSTLGTVQSPLFEKTSALKTEARSQVGICFQAESKGIS